MKKGSKKQFCKYGHDTFQVGRTNKNACKVCTYIYGLEYHKRYRQTLKSKQHGRKVRALSQRKKRQNPWYRLAGNLRTRLGIALKQKALTKNSKLFEYLGCSIEVLVVHLEKQFQSGMSWNNYGRWHPTLDKWNIDHITPLSIAKTEEELYKLCHYTNLQPLWARENSSKKDKVLGI